MMTTWIRRAGLFAAAMAVSASAASAQYAAPLGQSGDALDTTEIERRAAEATVEVQDWAKAARLYRRAAEMREGDPAAAKHFRKAGLLAYYSGHQSDAVRDLTRAAESALEFGDLSAAARSFLDAAFVAEADGRSRNAFTLAQRAERLAQSPLLGAGDRAALMRRITEEPVPPEMPRN